MDSDCAAPLTLKSGKLRFILNPDLRNTETSTNSEEEKPKKTGRVRFADTETPSTSKQSGRPRAVVPRAVKKIQKYNKKRMFDVHIHRLMKITRPDVTISRDAIDVLNTFCVDIMDRITKAASDLVKYNKTSTLGMREIKSATKLVLPSELADFGIADANKAWKKYEDSKKMVATENEDPMCVCKC